MTEATVDVSARSLEEASPVGFVSIAEQANTALAKQSDAHQAQVRATLRQRIADVIPRIVLRRYEDANFHAQQLVLGINAVRMHHTDDLARASQVLDQFLFSARTAIESSESSASTDGKGWRESRDSRAGTDDDAGHWFLPAGSLQATFEFCSRAYESGRLAREHFMSGHQELVAEVMGRLHTRLGISAPFTRFTPPIEQLVADANATRAPSHGAADLKEKPHGR